MTTSPKNILTGLALAVLATVASAQIAPPFPSGINDFSNPAYPSNVANYASDLGDLYFDSDLNVPSSIALWTNGPVNFNTALGGSPWLAGGGSVKVIFLGETASWKNDFGYTASNAPGTHNPLVTDIENDVLTPGNITSGMETVVNYNAGANLDFFLNSGGDLSQGGLFYAFGTPNEFSGADVSDHTKWSTRLVTTTYFDGSSVVTEDILTLLIGYEDVRQGVGFHDGDSNDFVVGFQFLPTQNTPVPEPSTYGLMGAVALLGVVGYRRFKRTSVQA